MVVAGRRIIRVAVVGALALGVAGSDAGAHGSDPSIETVVGLARPLPGVETEVVQSVVPELSIVNRSRTELEVLDSAGTPFLRLGPRGTEGNLDAASFYRSGDPSGAEPVPARALRPHAPPVWAVLSRTPAWGFFDPRMRADIAAAPPAVRAGHRPAVLARWSIPLRYGATTDAASGAVEYRPPVGGALAQMSSPLHPAPGLTAALTPGAFPDLFLTDSGAQPVTVIGRDGEPFARIGPNGVSVNLRSPTHVDDVVARGERPAQAADAAAPPVWQHVSSSQSYDWLEARARYAAADPPPAALERAGPTVLRRWSVPLELGARRLDLAGTIDWVPSADASAVLAAERTPGSGSSHGGGDIPVAWPALAAAAALVAAVAVRYARRSRLGADDPIWRRPRH